MVCAAVTAVLGALVAGQTRAGPFDGWIDTRIRSALGGQWRVLEDEPSPSSCPAADLKGESDWIHTNDPGAKTFIIEQNLSASYHPNYMGGYTPGNSDIDYYGLDPYS